MLPGLGKIWKSFIEEFNKKIDSNFYFNLYDDVEMLPNSCKFSPFT